MWDRHVRKIVGGVDLEHIRILSGVETIPFGWDSIKFLKLD